MPVEIPSSKPLLNAFLEQYWKDRNVENVRPLRAYLDMFPGDDDAISAEYVALERGVSGNGPAVLPGTGARLGNYRILRELGRGGQATVYLSEDTTLGRQVALKVLEGLGAVQKEVIARFRREALAASALQHPGVCAVYEAKFDSRVPYIAMQYVEGETLARRIATTRERLTPDTDKLDTSGEKFRRPLDDNTNTEFQPLDQAGIIEAVLLVEKSARALHAAHEAGIIHRDIKPGNIMVTPTCDTVVLDFGLARQEESDLATLTRTGDLFGTPAYMSPEQLTRQTLKLDRRTDIWSLGVTLYECLALRRPFETPTREGLYQAILTKDPPDIRKLNRAVHDDLQVVVATAIEKDRDRRYQTAEAFAEDLRRVREHEPILARPVGPFGRLIRWAQRNPAVAALAAAVFLVLVGGLATTLVQKVRADANATDARSNLTEYERLADARMLDDLLREQAEELWPAVPEKVLAMERWLDRAREVARRLPEHEAALFKMRKKALPWTEEQKAKDRASHKAELEQLAILENERDRLSSELKAIEASSLPGGRKEQRKEDLEVKLVEAEEKLAGERRLIEPLVSERLTYEFQDPNDPTLLWRQEKLADLVIRLWKFVHGGPKEAGLKSVEERLESARTLERRTVQDHAEAWKACRSRIASNSRYAPGTLTKPEVGLIPLGQDPSSSLEEFCDPATGDPPVRDPSTGKLVVTEKMGLVFVLLPGGTFWMGAQRVDPSGRNFDRNAQINEGPPHEVTLSSFFLSKFEMTQGQWLRATNENPSKYRPGNRVSDSTVADLRHPVERVNWHDCMSILSTLTMELPTEAQWEYACRATASTPWWCAQGDLPYCANVADQAHRTVSYAPQYESWNDGFGAHAPVGTYRSNLFGFHEMIGNVWEWCQDSHSTVGGSLKVQQLGGSAKLGFRAMRGGGFNSSASVSRSAFHAEVDPSLRDLYPGVRPSRHITP